MRADPTHDIAGRRFGRLVIIRWCSPEERPDRRPRWVARCDCGNEVNVRGDSLLCGNTESCGCLARDVRQRTIAAVRIAHPRQKPDISRCCRPQCGALLPVERKSRRCVDCDRDAKAKHKSKHGDALRAKQAEVLRRSYAENPEAYRRYARDQRARLRAEFLAEYGGRCVCCKESEPAFLTLEHKNRDGAQHRAQRGDSTQILRDLRRRGWPKDAYEILCFNCNRARWVLGRCPHEDASAARVA